jgi:AcrR family transcriptional regulator
MSSQPAPSRRRYDSSRRREQARRTREEILDAARRLFLTRGYGATPMTAVAHEAGVSVETIYGAYDSKAGLFRAVVDVALRGDEDPVPFVEREAIQSVIAERDPRRQLDLYGAILAEVQPRIGPLTRLMRDAAASEPDLSEVWAKFKADRLEGMTSFAGLLRRRGALRRGVSPTTARDVLWTLNSPEVYDLLVTERGWSPQRYGAWVADQLAAALLDT